MPVESHRFDSVDAFLDVAGPFLETREPEHQLTLGIVGDHRAEDAWPEDGALVAALDDGRVVATAIWTPPWNLILSEVDELDAIDAIAERMASASLAGVHAPEEHAEAFARAWTGRTGERFRLTMRQRSYALESVIPPRDVQGRLRLAVPDDRDLMVDWMLAFDNEAMGAESGRRDMSALVDAMLSSSTRMAYLWDMDGEPVSMCQATGATPHGMRIGAVYTPRELRRRGYASALTAAASQLQLDGGRRWCFLFTDLANPTSNRIYQAIGYRPVRDVQLIRFERQ